MWSWMSWSLAPQAPYRRPSRTGIVVAALAVLLAAGGVYLLSRTHHRPRPVTATTGQPAQPVEPTVRGDGSPRRAAPGEVDLSGVSWRDFHGIRLPYSRANGPARSDGGRVWGFADTAGGAVFAAVHIGVRANAQWGPHVYGPTVRDQIDGPDKSTLLDQLDSAYAQLADGTGDSSGGPIGRAYAVEEGFRVESFAPGAATVDVVTAGPGNDGTTVRAATRIQLTWCGSGRGGDWHVLAPPDGDWGASAHVITSATNLLDGYRSFGDQQGGA